MSQNQESRSSGAKRDDWMTTDSFDTLLASGTGTSRQKKEEERLAAKHKQGEVHSRELNPNLRKDTGPSEARPTSTSAPSSSSWKRMLIQKSLDRVKKGEGSLEEIATERFGSLEAFKDACKACGVDISSYLRKVDKSSQPPIQIVEMPTTESKFDPTENINKLVARKLKAEMGGDRVLARQIEEQILKINNSKVKIQLLPSEIDRKNTVKDDSSIAQLVQHERLASSHELDEELAGRIAKDSRFSTRHEDMEEFGDRYDEERASKRVKQDEKSVKGAAIARMNRMERIQKSCWFCIDSKKADKSLIIAYGQYTYLALPKSGQLDPLHCQIVPLEHCSSLLQCSDQEGVWDEVRNFKKCLLQMAAGKGQRIVFLEASMDFPRSKHSFIDCVPLPADLSIDPTAYFKKALLECDAEWAQHKKIFDTSDPASGGLRKAVPKNFPYLYVDFRLDQGFAHVVEDEEKIGPDYLRWLTAGLIGIGTDYKAKVTSEETKRAFLKSYEPHDWTKLLHES